MTTLVIHRNGIMSDCGLTLKIEVTDQAGNKVSVAGMSSEYCKVGINTVPTSNGIDGEAYAVFGDIETAQALYALINAAGIVNAEEVLKALSRFKLTLPTVESGFAWINYLGEPSWISIDRNEYKICKKDINDVVALGSGAHLFDAAYKHSEDVVVAFEYAIFKDEQSSSFVYDRWDSNTGAVQRYNVPNNGELTDSALINFGPGHKG